MSGLVGIWHRDGRPVNPQLLQRMSATLAHRGRDGEHQWVHGPAGFACHLLHVTPESLHETQPVVDAAGRALVFDGRLDNRDVLLERLRAHEPVTRHSSDPELVLAAYRQAGNDMPSWLLGDFALALCDPATHQWVLARDALGVRPLYYYRTDDLLLVASEIKAILAHPDVTTRPDDNMLADFLVGQLHDPHLTFFDGILKLPRAHMAVATPDRWTLRNYWNFNPAREIRLASFHEYAEAFRDLFAQAVRRRLRSAHPVAISVSGGVDSSCIFSMADQLLKDHAYCPSLFGVSFRSPEGSPADEHTFVDLLASTHGRPMYRVPLHGGGAALHAQEAVRITETPYLEDLWNSLQDNLSAAVDHGARTLITGHWADQHLFHQDYLVDLARQMRWRTVRQHLRTFGQWFTDTEPHVFYEHFWLDLVKYTAPRALLPFLHQYRPRPKRPWYGQALHARARERLWAWHRQRNGTYASAYAQAFYDKASIDYNVLCLEWDNKIAAQRGLEMVFPYLDRDLLAFVQAIPGDIAAWQGVPKAILRAALQGIAPEPILGRRWKADFTQATNAGMAAEYPRFVEQFDGGRRATARGYLNEHIVSQGLARLQDGCRGATAEFAWALCDIVGLEVWLQIFFHNGARQTTSQEVAA